MSVIVKDRTANHLRATKLLTKARVLVGVPQSEDARDDGPLGNAAIAYIHDQGSPSQNIPARSFMEPGIEDAKDKIAAQFRRAGVAAMNGDEAGVEAGLNGAGLVAANSVQKKIVNGPFEPLSEKTLKARRRRGRTGEKPLIDTAQMLRSITHVLRKS